MAPIDPTKPLPPELEAMITGIIGREGSRYTNDPDDGGGPTRYGVTLARLAEYRGRPVTAADVQALTESEARAVYRDLFVVRPRFAEIMDPDLRELVIDTGVNHGQPTAARWLQAAVGGLKVDGECGPLTLRAVNAAPARRLFADVLVWRIAGYADIVQSRPSQVKYLEGWNARAATFIRHLV